MAPTPPRPSQTLVLAQHGISSIPDLLERGGPGPSPYPFLLIPSTHAALTKLGMEQAPEMCTRGEAKDSAFLSSYDRYLLEPTE